MTTRKIRRLVLAAALSAVVFGVSGCAPSGVLIDSLRRPLHPLVSEAISAEASSSARPSPPLVVTGAPVRFQHPFDVKAYLGRPLYETRNAKGEVALTFDDGPSARTTEAIARILRRHHAHGTFFFVGDRAVRGPGPAIVRHVEGMGDDIGNHTWTHSDLKGLSYQAVDQEIGLAQSALAKIDGGYPIFVRPRGGKVDAVGLDEANRLGLIITLWSIDGYDIGSATPAKIAQRATQDVKAGSIIGLHDRNPNTIRALPAILRRLRRKGLRAVTLSQLVADSTPSWFVPASFSTEDMWVR